MITSRFTAEAPWTSSIDVPQAGRYKVEIVAWADQAGDALPQLDVAVLNATNSGKGAEAIRAKLVELHDTLLGVEVTPYSPGRERCI